MKTILTVAFIFITIACTKADEDRIIYAGKYMFTLPEGLTLNEHIKNDESDIYEISYADSGFSLYVGDHPSIYFDPAEVRMLATPHFVLLRIMQIPPKPDWEASIHFLMILDRCSLDCPRFMYIISPPLATENEMLILAFLNQDPEILNAPCK
ncbi:MAG: hypothetical protein R3F07_09005 [Opitutaceae bacterium]